MRKGALKNVRNETKLFRDGPLREDEAKFLHFCGTENFRFQSYDLKSLIIVNSNMLTISRVFG